MDRSALILDIFAPEGQESRRQATGRAGPVAASFHPTGQGWTHLERQKGGIGLRGPGEKQLETDRRLLGERVKMLKGRLAGLERQRAVRRRARERRDVLTVSWSAIPTPASRHSLMP